MVIMALDHVRDMVHVTAITQNPTNLQTTTPLLFFTRWITHLCAPTFVFLAGVSVYIQLKEKGVQSTRSFLLKRGLWLIVLELTVVNFALWFDIRFRTLIFEVIAAIGFGFVVLSLLVKLSSRNIGIIGISIITLHNLFPLIPFGEGSQLGVALRPLFLPNAFPTGAQSFFIIGYPPIPWLGIMLAGFSIGNWFYMQENEMQKRFLKAGLIVLLLFVVIRFLNFYGDFPWSPQKNAVFTFLSFNNITKYPPSLLFVLSTIGISLLILAYTSVPRKFESIFLTYGKVPLFYFVVHLFLVHAVTLVILLLQGFAWSDLNFGTFAFGRPKEPSGLELWAVYLMWILVVISLYYPCRWYARFKESHRDWNWLRYL